MLKAILACTANFQQGIGTVEACAAVSVAMRCRNYIRPLEQPNHQLWLLVSFCGNTDIEVVVQCGAVTIGTRMGIAEYHGHYDRVVMAQWV